MAHYKYKAKITDDVVDAKEIIMSVGRSIQQNHADKDAVLTNLAAALAKLESAMYYIERE